MLDPRTISVVAWDLDNTLFDRDAAVRRFFRWYLTSLGRDTQEPGGTDLLGAIMALDQGGDGDRSTFCREVCELCGQAPEAAPALWAAWQAKLPEFIWFEHKALASLFWLRSHFRHALVSNGGSALQRAKLRRAGVRHHFAAGDIFISGEVGFEKPDARMFGAALRALGKRPEQVLHVGDHPTNDIAGATAVGMRTCWVSRGRTPPSDLHADMVVEHPGKVAALLLPRR